jgi:hypothetical protein
MRFLFEFCVDILLNASFKSSLIHWLLQPLVGVFFFFSFLLDSDGCIEIKNALNPMGIAVFGSIRAHL